MRKVLGHGHSGGVGKPRSKGFVKDLSCPAGPDRTTLVGVSLRSLKAAVSRGDHKGTPQLLAEEPGNTHPTPKRQGESQVRSVGGWLA